MESLLPMFPPGFCYELDWYMIDGDRVVTHHRDGFPDPRGSSPIVTCGSFMLAPVERAPTTRRGVGRRAHALWHARVRRSCSANQPHASSFRARAASIPWPADRSTEWVTLIVDDVVRPAKAPARD